MLKYVNKHEDDRRILLDFATGNFKCAKAIIIKSKDPIGNHRHKNMDEEFLLVEGKFIVLQVGKLVLKNINAPFYVCIPKDTYHKFICKVGSILFGVSTEPFDDNDKIK